MPQLIGVKTVSDNVIEFKGYRYEKTKGPAQEGDIVRHDYGYTFLPRGTFYVVDDEGKISDEEWDRHPVDESEETLFRRTAALSAADTLAQKRAELERLTEEIAELTTKLAEESRPKVGDYARVVGGSINDVLADGKIVLVEKMDASEVPYYVKALMGGDADWCVDAERITPAEARAALIAQVDALFSGEGAAATSE